MKIQTIKSLTDKIRKHTKYEPPQPRNKDLPPTYNIILSASPKGGGKTYNTIQLLTNYEDSGFIAQDNTDVKMRTIWVSGGTSRSKQNSILDTLKTLHDEDRIDLEDDVNNYMKILKKKGTISKLIIFTVRFMINILNRKIYLIYLWKN
jgi:hypothetical protein